MMKMMKHSEFTCVSESVCIAAWYGCVWGECVFSMIHSFASQSQITYDVPMYTLQTPEKSFKRRKYEIFAFEWATNMQRNIKEQSNSVFVHTKDEKLPSIEMCDGDG